MTQASWQKSLCTHKLITALAHLLTVLAMRPKCNMWHLIRQSTQHSDELGQTRLWKWASLAMVVLSPPGMMSEDSISNWSAFLTSIAFTPSRLSATHRPNIQNPSNKNLKSRPRTQYKIHFPCLLCVRWKNPEGQELPPPWLTRNPKSTGVATTMNSSTGMWNWREMWTTRIPPAKKFEPFVLCFSIECSDFVLVS